MTHISKITRSRNCAIQNHSGVMTCRVAETREPHNSHKLWAQRTCDRLEDRSLFWTSKSILFDVHEKVGEDLRASITEEVKEFGEIATADCPTANRILKYQRRPTSNRRCISTIPWKSLQILISKMESYTNCWLHHCLPRQLRWNLMHWSCTRER